MKLYKIDFGQEALLKEYTNYQITPLMTISKGKMIPPMYNHMEKTLRINININMKYGYLGSSFHVSTNSKLHAPTTKDFIFIFGLVWCCSPFKIYKQQ